VETHQLATDKAFLWLYIEPSQQWADSRERRRADKRADSKLVLLL